MSFQLHQRIYGYISEYQSLVYDYYSKNAISFLTTYYNINTSKTVWEDEKMFSGSYERIGEYSGVKWDKYLLLPIYFPEDITTAFDASEIGYVKENETHIVFPSTYNITPYPGDLIKLEQSYLRPTNDTYPLFIITGAEKSTNADRTFWRLKLEIEQSKTTSNISEQIEDTYTFFEYTKKIYTPSQATFLARLLEKSEEVRGNLKDLFDQNSGLYLI